MDANQTVALFEYTLDGKVNTVASEKAWLAESTSILTRTLMHYTSALNTIMRHYNLTDPNIPVRLVNIEAAN
jgi:hypothetical protein